MKGMEFFNEDLSDGFEFDENLLLDDGKDIGDDDAIEVKSKQTKTQIDNNDDNDDDKNDDDDDKLDLITPTSTKVDDDGNVKQTVKPKFFSALVQALKEEGILADVEEDKITSQEDFLGVIEESIKSREFADLTEPQKEYLEAIRAGIPHEDVVEYQRNIDQYSSITEDAITEESDDGSDLRRTIIMNNFITKGISEAKAKKLTDKIFDSGEDIDEAKESLNELITLEKQQFELDKQNRIKQRELAAKSEKEAVDKLNKIVKETKELIPGLQIPQTLKNNIIKGLTQPVGYTEDKRPLDIISKYLYENPIDGRFKLAYLLSVTDGMKNMKVLENKKAKNNAFKELEAAMKFKEEGGIVGANDGLDSQWNLDDIQFL